MRDLQRLERGEQLISNLRHLSKQSASRDPMFNLPGEINVGTNSTVELIVDEKLLEQLQAGYRGIAWRRCAASLM